MEGREGAPAAATTENRSDAAPQQALQLAPPPVVIPVAVAPPPVMVGPGAMAGPSAVKKKRGRPRKYGPEGSLMRESRGRGLLSPMPISASMPAGEFQVVSTPPSAAKTAGKQRGRGRPGGFMGVKQQQPSFQFDNLSEKVSCAAGANFTPHVMTVATGEDITKKILSFSQQGPRAICILSANGAISNVTLHQPDSFGGTLTFEGRFELLSLSGSFMPTENGGTRGRAGGMSVSLSSPNGQVHGGGVAGNLVAAGPVQVVIGSFLPNYEIEQKAKRPRYETIPISVSATAYPINSTNMESSYGGGTQGQQGTTQQPNTAPSSSFKGHNWSASVHSMPDDRTTNTSDMNMPVPGG